MQDGAAPLTSKKEMEFLSGQFSGERMISRNARIVWPNKSLDLNPNALFMVVFERLRFSVKNQLKLCTDMFNLISCQFAFLKMFMGYINNRYFDPVDRFS